MRCTNCYQEGNLKRYRFPERTDDLCVTCQDAVERALQARRRKDRQPLVWREE
jgi:hypothetical protein